MRTGLRAGALLPRRRSLGMRVLHRVAASEQAVLSMVHWHAAGTPSVRVADKDSDPCCLHQSRPMRMAGTPLQSVVVSCCG